MSNYLKTVRPVKNYSNPVDVKFDIALRAIVDLVGLITTVLLYPPNSLSTLGEIEEVVQKKFNLFATKPLFVYTSL